VLTKIYSSGFVKIQELEAVCGVPNSGLLGVVRLEITEPKEVGKKPNNSFFIMDAARTTGSAQS
jgi:hypothetical protein